MSASDTSIGLARQSLWKNPRALAYLVTAALLLLVFRYSGNETVLPQVLPGVELVSAFLAALVGITGLAHYCIFNTRSLLFVSLGFIGVSLADTSHFVFTLAAISTHLPHPMVAATSWTPTLSGVYLAALLVAGRDAARGEITVMSGPVFSNRVVCLWTVLFAAVLIILAFVLPAPQSFEPGSILYRPLELIPAFMFLGILLLFLLKGYWRYYSFQHWFVLSLIFVSIYHLVYMPVTIAAHGEIPAVASGLKLGSYLFAFVAMSSSTIFLFRRATEERVRQRTEELIRENQIVLAGHEQSISISHSVPTNAGWELSFDTGIFKANKVTTDTLGIETDMRDIEQFQALVHPDDIEPLLEALHRSRTRGDLFKQEFRFKHPNRDYIWIESIAGVEMFKGKPNKLLGFLVDVTTRKEAEIEKDILLSELEQIKATLDQHAATAILDLDGQFISVNKKYCIHSGYSSEELIGRNIEILNSDSHPPAAFRDLWETAAPGHSWHGELCNRSKDGTLTWGATSITPHLNRHGEIDSFISLSTDITDRVIAEQALVESVQAHKQSNEDLQQFANIVSHDMQEPLRMVSSFVTLLSRRYGDKLDDGARQYIKFAVDGAKRMQDLLQGLLEFSRVQTRGEPFSDLDLAESVEAAVNNLAVLIEETGADITIEPLVTVKGDKTQLMQLFQNLIANAIKFCEEPPPIIHISARQEEDGWSVAVADKGIGIDPKNFERVFKIFQRLHALQEYKGTGVGLAVCKRIMERHKGTISVESELGKGSTFILRFPA